MMEEIIYQIDPPYGKKSTFRAKGWTETSLNYIKEAEKLTQCLQRNMEEAGERYTWHCIVNIEQVMPPADIAALWTKVCRKLRSFGVVALWIREPSSSNSCHYHLLARNQEDEAFMANAIEAAMPPRSEVSWHKRVSSISHPIGTIRYITKAKTAGVKNGRMVADKYESKRRLFRQHLKLRKYGSIGPFWVRSKKSFWDEIKVREACISEFKDREDVQQEAKHLFQLLDGEVSHSKILRALAFHARKLEMCEVV